MIQVTGVLIIQNGEYVVQKRDNIPTIAMPGKYSAWGGHVEEGETPEESALRELQEETGIYAKIQDLKFLTDYETVGAGPRTMGKPVHMFLYVFEAGKQIEIHCYEGEKLERVKSLEELGLDNCANLLIKAVEAYEQQKP